MAKPRRDFRDSVYVSPWSNGVTRGYPYGGGPLVSDYHQPTLDARLAALLLAEDGQHVAGDHDLSHLSDLLIEDDQRAVLRALLRLSRRAARFSRDAAALAPRQGDAEEWNVRRHPFKAGTPLEAVQGALAPLLQHPGSLLIGPVNEPPRVTVSSDGRYRFRLTDHGSRDFLEGDDRPDLSAEGLDLTQAAELTLTVLRRFEW